MGASERAKGDQIPCGKLKPAKRQHKSWRTLFWRPLQMGAEFLLQAELDGEAILNAQTNRDVGSRKAFHVRSIGGLQEVTPTEAPDSPKPGFAVT